jgi:xylulose-5-phosphate/fructose-6-phosphate phosphoketolase
MKSYRADELFDERGKFREEFAALAPTGHRRMGSNPHADGGGLLCPYRCLISETMRSRSRPPEP